MQQKPIIYNETGIQEEKKNPLKQWNEYINNIHYKIFMKEKNLRLSKDIDKLNKYNDKLNSIYRYYDKDNFVQLTKLKTENNPEKSLNLYLDSRVFKENLFQKIKNIFWKFD